jgi:arylsulfatase
VPHSAAWSTYDELVHVPLLLRWPDHLNAGTRVGAVVRIVDVAPTILDLLAVARPPRLDGASVLPLLRGEELEPRVALTENLLFAEERVGLRTPTYTYVRWENGKEELYDLTKDPGEIRDLAGSGAPLDIVHRLYAALAPEEPAVPPRSGQPPFDGGTEAALRALGYVH